MWPHLPLNPQEPEAQPGTLKAAGFFQGRDGAGLTRISSPSLVSSRLQEVLGPSPFRSLCSHTILFSRSHFTKLCKKPEAKELIVRACVSEREKRRPLSSTLHSLGIPS